MDNRIIRILVVGVVACFLAAPLATVWAGEVLRPLPVKKSQLEELNKLAEVSTGHQFKARYFGATIVMPFSDVSAVRNPKNESLKWALLSSMSRDLGYVSTMSPWPLWMIFEELRFECRELQSSCIDPATPQDLINRVKEDYVFVRGESLELDYKLEKFLLAQLTNIFITGDYRVEGENVLLQIRVSRSDKRNKLKKVHEWSINTNRHLVLDDLSESLVTELQKIGVVLDKKTIGYIQSSKSTDAEAIELFGQGVFADFAGTHTSLDSEIRTTALNALLDAVERDDNFAEAWLALARVMRSIFPESNYQWAYDSAFERKPILKNLILSSNAESQKANDDKISEQPNEWLVKLSDLSFRSVSESRVVKSTLQALYLSLYIKDINERERLGITLTLNLANYYAKKNQWEQAAQWSKVGLEQLDAVQSGGMALWKVSANSLFLLFQVRAEIIQIEEGEPEIDEFISAATLLANFALIDSQDYWTRLRTINVMYDYARKGLGNYRLRNIFIPMLEIFRNSLFYDEFVKKKTVIGLYDWVRYLDIILAIKYTDANRFDDAIRSYDSYIQSDDKPNIHKDLLEARVLISQASIKDTMGYTDDAAATAARAIALVRAKANNIDGHDKATRWDIKFMAQICRSYLEFLTSRGSLEEAERERLSLGELLGIDLNLTRSGVYSSEK